MLSGISAANYSHVHFFPERANYDEFYELVIRVVKIAFEDFAEYAQELLVQHLRAHFGDRSADWYEEFRTGARGRYCLAHSMHGGTNNNMGVEVDWRDIKKLCPPSCSLSTFLGALFHFIKELGKEHEQVLIDAGEPNFFISEPRITKELWDGMQELHPKTLSTTFLVRQKDSHGRDLAKAFAERVREIDATEGSALHIKIQTWHENNRIDGIKVGFPQMEDMHVLLMPRQHVLKRIDPTNSKSVEEVRSELRDLSRQYVAVVINDKRPADMTVSNALDLYETFHHLERKADWAMLPIPLSCSCATNHKDCCCKHGGLVASVFDPKIKVPSEYVAAEPGLRKKCRQIKGTAGPRRARLMSAIQQEKKKTASKLPFMSMRSCNGVAAEGGSALPPSPPPPAAPTSPPPPAPIPDRYDPVIPEDIVIPEVEFPSSGDEDFQVLFTALCIPSSPD